ncbi:MAG TPA: alpha/beta hydrolase [Gemmatimonadota bacterium]|nr:alpha/beta hydrolase [Gemmatimonadota bacterium]
MGGNRPERGLVRAAALAVVMLAAEGAPGQAQAPPAVERTVTLPTGVELRYVEAGSPAAETVVFLHGYTDSNLSFRSTIEALLERRPDLRILALDLRGHGGSSMPPVAECAPEPWRCFRVEDFARDVLAFLEALDVDRTHVVGHSYGSMVAQDVALAAPDRIASIVLIGSAARTVGNPAIEQFVLGQLIEGTWRPELEARGLAWPADVYQLTPIEIDPGAEEWLLANWVTEIAGDPDYLAEMASRTARLPLGAWLGVARAALEFDNVARLADLTVPTLVLWGSQDAVTAESDQVVLRAALDAAAKACRTTYVWKIYGREPLPASGVAESDFGHNFQWGAGPEVAADIAAWLETGAPSEDLTYVDPAAPGGKRTARGEADLIRGPDCS